MENPGFLKSYEFYPDIIRSFIQWLPPQDLCSASLVCRTFARTCSSAPVWRRWCFEFTKVNHKHVKNGYVKCVFSEKLRDTRASVPPVTSWREVWNVLHLLCISGINPPVQQRACAALVKFCFDSKASSEILLPLFTSKRLPKTSRNSIFTELGKCIVSPNGLPENFQCNAFEWLKHLTMVPDVDLPFDARLHALNALKLLDTAKTKEIAANLVEILRREEVRGATITIHNVGKHHHRISEITYAYLGVPPPVYPVYVPPPPPVVPPPPPPPPKTEWTVPQVEQIFALYVDEVSKMGKQKYELVPHHIDHLNKKHQITESGLNSARRMLLTILGNAIGDDPRSDLSVISAVIMSHSEKPVAVFALFSVLTLSSSSLLEKLNEVEDLSCEKVTLVYHSFMRGDGILFELLVFVEAAAERAAVEWSQVVTVIGSLCCLSSKIRTVLLSFLRLLIRDEKATRPRRFLACICLYELDRDSLPHLEMMKDLLVVDSDSSASYSSFDESELAKLPAELLLVVSHKRFSRVQVSSAPDRLPVILSFPPQNLPPLSNIWSECRNDLPLSYSNFTEQLRAAQIEFRFYDQTAHSQKSNTRKNTKESFELPVPGMWICFALPVAEKAKKDSHPNIKRFDILLSNVAYTAAMWCGKHPLDEGSQIDDKIVKCTVDFFPSCRICSNISFIPSIPVNKHLNPQTDLEKRLQKMLRMCHIHLLSQQELQMRIAPQERLGNVFFPGIIHQTHVRLLQSKK